MKTIEDKAKELCELFEYGGTSESDVIQWLTEYEETQDRKWQARFEWLAGQFWVADEAEFRLSLPESDDFGKYMEDIVEAIDKKL